MPISEEPDRLRPTAAAETSSSQLRSAMKNGDNGLQPERQPGPLAALLGGRVEQFYALPDAVPVDGDLLHTRASIWAELLSTSSPDTRVVLRYGKSNGWLDGQPAVTPRRVDAADRLLYVGTVFDDAAMKTLTAWLLSEAKVTRAKLVVPDGVEASERRGDGKILHILVNLADKVETVKLPTPMVDEMHDKHSVREVVLPISGVAVLSEIR